MESRQQTTGRAFQVSKIVFCFHKVLSYVTKELLLDVTAMQFCKINTVWRNVSYFFCVVPGKVFIINSFGTNWGK